MLPISAEDVASSQQCAALQRGAGQRGAGQRGGLAWLVTLQGQTRVVLAQRFVSRPTSGASGSASTGNAMKMVGHGFPRRRPKQSAVLGALLLTVGCGGGANTSPAATGVPEWYVPGTSPFDAGNYLVGRGACGPSEAARGGDADARSCATARAVAALVLAVRARVTAEQSQVCSAQTQSEGGSGGSSAARAPSREYQTACAQRLASRAAGALEVSNIVPRAAACDESGTTCHVLVAIDRAQLAAELRHALDPELAALEDALAKAKAASPLSAQRHLSDAIRLAPRVDEALQLIYYVEQGIPKRSWYREVLATQREARRALRVCFESGEAPDLFAQVMKRLRREGVGEVRVASACPDAPDVAKVALATTPATSSAGKGTGDHWVALQQGTLTLRRPEQAAAEHIPLQARSLASGRDRALRDVRRQLAEEIESAVAAQVLGTQP